jgi:hypothetical protein
MICLEDAANFLAENFLARFLAGLGQATDQLGPIPEDATRFLAVQHFGCRYKAGH